MVPSKGASPPTSNAYRQGRKKAEANPFNPRFKEYFKKREKNGKQSATATTAGLKLISLARA